MSHCQTCTCDSAPVPPEPPVGTWVRDRHGATAVRVVDSTGHDGWAPAPFGFYACAKWDAMWRGRGPLVECGPWGADATEGVR